MTYEAFDHLRPVTGVIVLDGIPTIVPTDRNVLDEHGSIEPLDERADTFVSIPIRTIHNPLAGIAVELGPFSLDAKEVVKLHNALADHINTFPSEYRMRPA